MFRFRSFWLIAAALSLSSACSVSEEKTTLVDFQNNLQSLCGKVVKGLVTSTDPQDDEWRKEVLTLGPISCPNTLTTVLPLAVGNDKSRVWTLTLDKKGKRLDFRHAHTLKDGSPDPVTGYGGVATAENSTATQAIFPVDDFSKDLFEENGLQVSMTNIWSITFDTNMTMTYKLSRKGRNFVADFYLNTAE